MTFARRLFLIAGIYGLIVLLPLYFLEEKTGRDYPPPITHPEHYYGFTWRLPQRGKFSRWIISSNPIRYRTMMIPPMLAKGKVSSQP